MARGRGVQVGRERRDEQRRHGQHEQQADVARGVRAEALGSVAQSADEECQAEHQQDVREDRADDRGADDVVEPGVQREQRDEQLRQVAERALHDPRRAGTQAVAQRLDTASDQARQQGQRDRTDDERRNVTAAGVTQHAGGAARHNTHRDEPKITRLETARSGFGHNGATSGRHLARRWRRS